MAERQSQRDRIKEITDGIEQGIKDLFNSDNFRQYLKTMSRFHHYSLNNIILIQQQCPHATHVAGFTKWKNEFGRNVRKGEKGIRILAPSFIPNLLLGFSFQYSAQKQFPALPGFYSLQNEHCAVRYTGFFQHLFCFQASYIILRYIAVHNCIKAQARGTLDA